MEEKMEALRVALSPKPSTPGNAACRWARMADPMIGDRRSSGQDPKWKEITCSRES